MSMKKALFAALIIVCFLVLFLIPANKISAQLKVTSALVKQDSIETPRSIIDSLELRSGTVSLETQRQAKSGNLAMLLSAIVPGMGQVYAHRYYTIPVIWGFGAYFVSSWIKADNTYKSLQRRYSEYIKLDTIDQNVAAWLQNQRNDWHNYRDGFAFYLVLTYLLNIVDAYVGATLYNFDVSDNLGGSAEIRFRIPFH
jgi:hypothetical protein